MNPERSSDEVAEELTSDSPAPYEVIVFDCDSTLVELEGIDWLASDLSTAELFEIEAMTNAAMEGERSLEDVFGERLRRIAPRASDLVALGAEYIRTMLPGARLLIDVLHFFGKDVHVVSGGLLPGVLALAESLGIPKANVHAVDISFDEAGSYAGFDWSSPLARGGGKPEVVDRLAKGRRVALVGDGLTDLEAASVCARFVAFGGVVRRETVFAGAVVHAEERDMVELIPFLLSASERGTLAATERFTDLF